MIRSVLAARPRLFRRKLRWRWEESPLIALLLPPTGHASSLLDFDSTLRLPARRRVNRAKPKGAGEGVVEVWSRSLSE